SATKKTPCRQEADWDLASGKSSLSAFELMTVKCGRTITFVAGCAGSGMAIAAPQFGKRTLAGRSALLLGNRTAAGSARALIYCLAQPDPSRIRISCGATPA